MACAAALAAPPAANAASTGTNAYTLDASSTSGAAVSGSGLYSVTTTWIQPTVICNDSNDSMDTWVGLDGFNGSSVKQIGLGIDCSSGSPAYAEWYDVYPSYPVYLSPHPVAAGDHITATVSRSDSTYTLKLADATRGWSVSRNVTSTSGGDDGAEIIVDSPTGYFPNFHTVYFSDSSIDGSALANWNPTLMDASNGIVYQDHTSAVSGGSFSITYLNE